jgi:hypothetical protein
VAEDSGTVQRFGMHFLQRSLSSLHRRHGGAHGGLAAFLAGDGFQLGPVSPPEALFESLLRTHDLYEGPPGPQSAANAPRTIGVELFSRFRIIHLTQQMRAAEDAGHTALLESLLESLRDFDNLAPITDTAAHGGQAADRGGRGGGPGVAVRDDCRRRQRGARGHQPGPGAPLTWTRRAASARSTACP